MVSIRRLRPDAVVPQRAYEGDAAQLRAVRALDRCAREWGEFKEQRSNVFKKLINRPEIPRGEARSARRPRARPVGWRSRGRSLAVGARV